MSMTEMKKNKAELSEEMLNEVAGGADKGKLIENGVEIVKKVVDAVSGGKDGKEGGGAPAPGAPGGNTQHNNNEHSAQQASQTGNNINKMGMTVK
jgi:hypothetical protein